MSVPNRVYARDRVLYAITNIALNEYITDSAIGIRRKYKWQYDSVSVNDHI